MFNYSGEEIIGISSNHAQKKIKSLDQTQSSIRSNNLILKYQMFTSSGHKNVGLTK